MTEKVSISVGAACELTAEVQSIIDAPREHLKRPTILHVEEKLAEKIVSKLKRQSGSPWIKYNPETDKFANYYYGQHPDWVNADYNPGGVREIVYEGDHYVSCYWNGCAENWFSTSTAFEKDPVKPEQPIYVMKSFPYFPPPAATKEQERHIANWRESYTAAANGAGVDYFPNVKIFHTVPQSAVSPWVKIDDPIVEEWKDGRQLLVWVNDSEDDSTDPFAGVLANRYFGDGWEMDYGKVTHVMLPPPPPQSEGG